MKQRDVDEFERLVEEAIKAACNRFEAGRPPAVRTVHLMAKAAGGGVRSGRK